MRRAPLAPEVALGADRARVTSGRLLANRAQTGVVAIGAIALLAVAMLGYRVYEQRRLEDGARAAFARGVVFLGRNQLASGEFPTFRWFDDDTSGRRSVRAVFTAAQLVHSLRFAGDGADHSRIRDRAVAFLVAHREDPGLWRYYGKGSPILPDVDDTATAWLALSEAGHLVDGGAVKALLANRTEDGLFATWIGEPTQWRKVNRWGPDMVVNLNALALFAHLGEQLPEVCRQEVDHARRRAFLEGTFWYPSPLAYTYFFSRSFADERASCLEEGIPEVQAYALGQQQQDGSWGDDLETALGVLTLLNTGYRGPALARGVKAILARQDGDGGWALAPHYSDGNHPPVNYGSPSLTTGFCLEALGKYLGR